MIKLIWGCIVTVIGAILTFICMSMAWRIFVHPEAYPSPPLIQAVERQNNDLLRKMLAEGSDPEVRTPVRNETALTIATRYHNYEAAEILLRYGANINSENTWGQTSLDDANAHVDQQRVDWLLLHGARHGSKPIRTDLVKE